MSEKELNSYRLTSGADPTDEMLSTIMKEVAQDAKEQKEKASIQLMENIQMKNEFSFQGFRWKVGTQHTKDIPEGTFNILNNLKNNIWNKTL